MNNSEILNRIKAARIKQAEQEKQEEENIAVRNSEYLERLKKAREKQQVTAVVGAEKEEGKTEEKSGLTLPRTKSANDLAKAKGLPVYLEAREEEDLLTPSNVVENVRSEVATELLKPKTSVMQRREVGKSGIPIVDEIAKEAAADVAVKEAVRDYGMSAGSPNKGVKEEKLANIEKAEQALAEVKEDHTDAGAEVSKKLRDIIENDPALKGLVADYWQKTWRYSQPLGEGRTAAQADALRDAAYEEMMLARETLTRIGYDADALRDAYGEVANKEETEKIVKEFAEYAKEHPVSATVKSVGLNAAGSLSALSGMLESTIRGEDIDTSFPAYAQLNAASAMREAISEDMTPAAQFAYNTGVSMADSLLMMPMGTLGTVVMGANALAQTSKEVLDNGGTKEQAWATGIVAGIAETLLEKVSLDQLKFFAKTPGRNFLSFMKNVGKGMITEGSEELFTDVVNTIGDALINGGNSEIERRYNDYIKSGMSEEDAWKKTAADYAKQLGLSFLGGAASGGVFGTGSQIIGNMTQKMKDVEIGKEVRSMGDAAIATQVKEGLKADGGTEQKRVAEKLNKKLTENKAYTDADVGAVAIENLRARAEKATLQIAETPEMAEEIETVDAEAGNAIARTVVTDLYDRANKMLEGSFDLERATVELNRTADNVRSNEGLLEGQKSTILKAVENVRERLTAKAESAATQTEEQISPEVEADREARAAKATSELQKSGILAGATDEQIEEVRAITEIFRKHGSAINVRFGSGMEVEGGTVNGKYDSASNTIYVNPKAKNPFAQVIAHEIVHRMANNNSDLYGEFVKAVTTFYANQGKNIDQLAKIKVAEYATFGIQLSEKQSVEEVAAQFVESYIHDRQAIRSLVRKHRSVAEWLGIRLRGLLGWLKPRQTREARYIQDALDILSQEMRGVDSDGMTAKERELKVLGDQYAGGEITSEEYDRKVAEIEGEGDKSHSISPAVDENGKQKIAAGMSDEQRYDILKDKSIRVASYDREKYEAARPMIKDINVIRFTDANRIGKLIADQFGAIRAYNNPDVELEFEYTKNGVTESMHKQKGGFDDYIKFLTIAEHVIENAKGLECHTDRYSGTSRADITNAGDFILIGAFEDEDGIVPVKLLVKQFTDKPNKLYVAITVNKIEAEIVALAKGNTAKHHPAPSASEYSLAQILENVNPADKTLIKYIPDGFLDDAQLAAKAEAIKEEREYIEKKTGVSYSISFNNASPVTRADNEAEAEQTTLALDEEDAKVAVPYEDEEGNLRFASVEEENDDNTNKANEALVEQIKAQNDVLRGTIEYLYGVIERHNGFVPTVREVEYILKDIANEFGVKRGTGELADRVVDIMLALERGDMDADEARNGLTDIGREIAKAQNEQVNEKYDHYRELYKKIHNTPIYIPNELRNSFDEYGGWAGFKENSKGILKFRNNENFAVDGLYGDLIEAYPDMFDEKIKKPQDMAKAILAVAKAIAPIYDHTLNDYQEEVLARTIGASLGSKIFTLMSDSDSKRILNESKKAKESYLDQAKYLRMFRENLVKRAEELAKKRRIEKQRIDRSRGKYVSLDKIEEALADGTYASKMIAVHEKMKEYRNALHNAKIAGYAPDIDKYTELSENIAKYIEAVGRKRHQIRDEESRTARGNMQEWGGKEGLLVGLRYATETPTRIIEDIAPNSTAAKQMLAYAFDPVRKNEANRQRWLRDLRERVKALNIGTKKVGKNANTESEAVQFVGEYTHVIDLLEGRRRLYKMDKAEWQKALDDFKAANPEMNWSEVERKAKAMREIYDEIYEELSSVLVTNGYAPVNKRGGYFPHFTENEPDSVLGKAASAIGLQIQGNELPTSIYGTTATFKPGKSYFGNLNKRTGNNTTYDALKGFEMYINGASNVIHHTDDIQRLRSLARVIRQDSADQNTRKQIEEIVNSRGGLTDEQKDLQINEMMQDAKYKLAGFVSWLDEYTNGLANKKSKYDRSMEELLGRTIYSLVSQLEGRVAANMVALNPGSWLTNFIPLTQAGALIDSKYMLKAAAMTVYNCKHDDGFTDQSDFLVSRKGSDPVVMAFSDKLSSLMSRPMEWIDGFVSQTIVRARYMQNVEKNHMSKEAALAEANVFAGKVMADRSKGATPTIFNSKNPLIKTFTQFQIEQNNQLRYLFKDIPRESEDAKRAAIALVAAMLKFAVGAYLFNDLYEYYIGRRPAFDIIGILNNTVGSTTGYKLPNILEVIGEVVGDARKGDLKEVSEYLETKKKGIAPALGEGGIELLENLPFAGGVLGGGRLPIANAIGNPFEVAGEALALIPTVDEETGEVVQNGSVKRLLKTAYDELSKPLYYLAPKFGGGQAKKVLEGAFAIAQKGSYTYNKKGEAQLQYPVLSDNGWKATLNWAGALVFGKTSTPWAREWIENNFKTRTVSETAAYKAMLEIGEQSSDAYAILDRIKEAKAEHAAKSKKGNSPYTSGTEAALAALKSDETLLEISKAQVYKHLLASSDEKEYLYGTIRYQDPALYKVLTAIRDVTTGSDISAKAQKQNLILDSELSDAAKVKVYRIKAASKEDEDFMDDMMNRGVSEFATLKVLTKAGSATKNSEKYKAVSTTSMTEAQRNAFMKQIMTDAQYSKYNLANSKGITTAVWAQFTARLEAVNKSGAASHEEVKQALAGMNIAQNQKAAIWQLQNKSWKAENNPFNPTVGKLIKDQME